MSARAKWIQRGSSRFRNGSHRRPIATGRRGDAETLGHVVHHEPDHEERAELELAERERRADGKPFAEVVDADPERDEQGEGEPGHPRAAARETG